jgi:S1-C subfamily serine protease
MKGFTWTLLAMSCLFTVAFWADAPSPDHLGAAKENVVMLVSASQRGLGTGFVLQYKGQKYILTNAHVCLMEPGTEFLRVYPNDGTKMFLAVIQHFDVTVDLCILGYKGNARGLTLADSSPLWKPATVYGHPLGNPLTVSKGATLSEGPITMMFESPCSAIYYRSTNPFESGTCLTLTWINYVYLSTHIYPGNSGSPVLDYWGDVQGIISAGQNISWYGYMVPVKSIHGFFTEYLTKKVAEQDESAD